MSGSKGKAWVVFDADEAVAITRGMVQYGSAVRSCGCHSCSALWPRIEAVLTQLRIFLEAVSDHPEYFSGGYLEASASLHPQGFEA